jgi:hypothetical protein
MWAKLFPLPFGERVRVRGTSEHKASSFTGGRAYGLKANQPPP